MLTLHKTALLRVPSGSSIPSEWIQTLKEQEAHG